MRYLALTALAAVPFFASPAGAQCAPPSGYYRSIDSSSAAALRRTLHARIENHSRVSWSGTWAVLERADQDPRNAGRILDVYKNASYAKVGRGNTNYDREHSWPKSLGFARSSGSNYPEADCHALFLCSIAYNGARANKMFRNLERTATEYATQGGGAGGYPGKSCWTDGVGVMGAWETWIGRRGDVARALLYLDVRYDGSRHRSGAVEPDLILTDEVQRIAASQSSANLPVAYMGLLSVLLQWHQQDPPDARECARNAAVYQAQGNRNPFIDHPEWAMLLFASPGRDLRRAWINEFHYDNAGADQGEMVELAGPAGLSLDGWQLLAYNGKGGRVYDSVFLRGTLSAAAGCTATLAVSFPGLQNGPADALALVDPRNRVVGLLGYEGSMMATDGAAVGLVAPDIGVAESSATPVGDSLQLRGTGMLASDFAWVAPSAQSRGLVNSGQTMVSGCGKPMVYGCARNPFGSLLAVDGLPSIGSTFTIGIHNPLGTQPRGSAAILAVSTAAARGYPCGRELPGFGMRAAAVPGELLLDFNLLVSPAPIWSGAPSVLALSLPRDSKLLGAVFYLQGAILSPGAPSGIGIGLTEGIRAQIGR